MTDFPCIIKTQRLILRALGADDAGRLFNLIDSNRAFIERFLDWPDYIQTVIDEEKYIESRLIVAANKMGFDWVIETPNGDTVGYIGTDPVTMELGKQKIDIDFKNKTISFAFFINPKFSGNGYMTEALGALIGVARGLGFRRVEIHAEPENKKSIAVAMRCGMTSSDEDDGACFINF